MNDLTTQPRVLASSERVSSPARNTIRLAVHCVGPLDLLLLQRAWEMVGNEAPGLAGTIRESGGDYVFHSRPDRAGLLTSVDGPPGDFRRTAHLTLDELDCVAALEVRSARTDSHVVSLLVRHSIADGKSGVHALSRIWQLYTELVGGEHEPTLRDPILASSLEAALEERTVPRGEPRDLDTSSPAVYHSKQEWDGQHLSGLCHGVVRLSENDTALLLRRCKAQSISLHGVLSAAVVLSMSRSRTDLHAFDLTSIIDVRPHLQPPMHPIEGTYILGFSTTTVDTTVYPDVDSIAKLVIENLRIDIESGAAQMSSIVNASLRSDGAVPTMLSNVGVVPTFAHPAGLEFTDFSVWNEMDLDNPGSADVLAVYGNMLEVSTFRGRLRVDLFHGKEMFPSDWTAAQVRQIEQTLTAYVTTG